MASALNVLPIHGDSIYIDRQRLKFSICSVIMARIARVIAEGTPYHITQRRNGRQQTFFSEEDYSAYLELMAEWCGKYDVKI